MKMFLLAVAVVVVVAAGWLVLRPSDDSDGEGDSIAEECEQAYDAGLGNAATSERESWVADCIAEIEAVRDAP